MIISKDTKKSKSIISYLKTIFSYDKNSGEFKRKKDWGNNRFKKGETAGHVRSDKYITLSVHGIKYKAHQVAWAFVYGYFPKKFIDHIDQNPSNNRISNLRLSDYNINNKNTKISKNNTSGFNGVCFNKSINQWRVQISHKNKLIYIGDFKEKQEAIKARKQANLKYGYHKNHGVKY